MRRLRHLRCNLGYVADLPDQHRDFTIAPILSNREGKKVAVIVNDMSEVNIDEDLNEVPGSNNK